MLNYIDRGSGKPIVLIHGFSDQSKSWFLVNEDLLYGYRLIAVDLPGHGNSDPWRGETLTIHDMSVEVDQVVRALGIGRFALVGHSMGGMVAQQYAVENPRSVSLLFPCCTAARGNLLGETEFNLSLMREVLQKSGIEKALKAADPYAAFAPGFESPLMEKYMELEYSTDSETALKCLDAIEGWALDKEAARRFEGRTTVICGEMDTITPSALSPEVAEAFPKSTLEKVRSSGHMVYMEKPEEFDFIIRTRLASEEGI